MRNDAGSPGFGKNGCQGDVYGRANTIGIPWKNVPQCAAILSFPARCKTWKTIFWKIDAVIHKSLHGQSSGNEPQPFPNGKASVGEPGGQIRMSIFGCELTPVPFVVDV